MGMTDSVSFVGISPEYRPPRQRVFIRRGYPKG
jgi:hypothetical protein